MALSDLRSGGQHFPLDSLRVNPYNYSSMGSQTNMRKTTIELTEEQYFFLKEKPWSFRSRIRTPPSCPSSGI